MISLHNIFGFWARDLCDEIYSEFVEVLFLALILIHIVIIAINFQPSLDAITPNFPLT